MIKAVFLDRDGVIIRSEVTNGLPRPPSTITDVQLLDGVLEAVEILRANCFEIVVVTNQPDVARGVTPRKFVEEVNSLIGNLLEIRHFYTCFHDDSDFCECRKPLPGLLSSAAKDLDIDLRGSYLVGDRWRDIEAGQSAGCQNFFIDYNYEEKKPKNGFVRVSSLLEAAQKILEESIGAK